MSGIEQIMAARWLAQNGTNKHILEGMIPLSEKNVKEFYRSAPKSPHRYGTHWLRCEGAYMADRAYRLFIQLFGNSALSKPLSVIEFSLYCQTYLTKFPSDDMSSNRLHYLIQSIRNGDAVVKDTCSCCGLPFVVHRDESIEKVCNICRVFSEKQQ